MSRIRPPLTTSMTGPVTTPSSSLICSMSPQARSYWARFLDRTSRPSLSSLVRTRASILSPRRHDLVRVDVVADRQLAAGDHALGLVADVEQDLVPVDLDDGALDELAVLDRHHGAVDGVLEAAAEVVLGDLARRVGAVVGERAHRGGRAGVDGFGVGLVGGHGVVGQGRSAFRSRGRDGSAHGPGRRAAGQATPEARRPRSRPAGDQQELGGVDRGRRRRA